MGGGLINVCHVSDLEMSHRSDYFYFNSCNTPREDPGLFYENRSSVFPCLLQKVTEMGVVFRNNRKKWPLPMLGLVR